MKTMYSTSDYALAAALTCAGFTIQEAKRINPKRVELYFEDSDGLRAAIQCYWAGNFPVDAKQFYDAMRSAKGMIFSV